MSTNRRERAHADAMSGPLPGSHARRLTPDDAPQVTVLQRCCWVEEALLNDRLDIPALHETLDDVRGWLADWHALGVWRDGRLLGMVRTLPEGTDLHLGRLAVVPDLRGQGLGRWLLRTAADTAGPHVRRIVLVTGAKSTRNIALYRSEGYQLAPIPGPDGTVSLAKDLPRPTTVASSSTS